MTRDIRICTNFIEYKLKRSNIFFFMHNVYYCRSIDEVLITFALVKNYGRMNCYSLYSVFTGNFRKVIGKNAAVYQVI